MAFAFEINEEKKRLTKANSIYLQKGVLFCAIAIGWKMKTAKSRFSSSSNSIVKEKNIFNKKNQFEYKWYWLPSEWYMCLHRCRIQHTRFFLSFASTFFFVCLLSATTVTRCVFVHATKETNVNIYKRIQLMFINWIVQSCLTIKYSRFARKSHI